MPVLTKINSNVIADDAISGDKLGGSAYLSNTATQNITGTYSENRLYTSDAYTLSGNATINSELILSSVKPNSDIVLTAGGAYTITGTGKLEAGSMYGRNTVTGMIGELGSAVTGTPALTGLGTVTSGTLGSSVTFPAGHVIQTIFNEYTTQADITSTNNASPDSTGLSCAITPKVAGSKILGMIDIHLMIRANSTVADAGMACMVHDGSSYIFTQGADAHMGLYVYGGSGDPSDEWRGLQSMKFFINATNTSVRTYTVYAFRYPSTNPPNALAQVNSSKSMFTLMEIAQ